MTTSATTPDRRPAQSTGIGAGLAGERAEWEGTEAGPDAAERQRSGRAGSESQGASKARPEASKAVPEAGTGHNGWFGVGGVADDLCPGPALAGFAADACAIGLGRLNDDELIGLMRAARRLASWAAAVELAAVGDLWRRRWAEEQAGKTGAARHADDEIAAALTLTGRAANQLLGLAVTLRRLPLTSQALTAGAIDVARAMVIVDEITGLDNEHAAAVEQVVIGAAGDQTTGQLRAAVRRAVLAADPRAARKRKEQALQNARVERWDEHAGTAALAGRDLPPASVLAADKNLTALARQLKAAGAPGTLDQLRAQVYLALLTGASVGSLIPAKSGIAAETHPNTCGFAATTSSGTPGGLSTGTETSRVSPGGPGAAGAAKTSPGTPGGFGTGPGTFRGSPGKSGAAAKASPGTPGGPGVTVKTSPDAPGDPGIAAGMSSGALGVAVETSPRPSTGPGSPRGSTSGETTGRSFSFGGAGALFTSGSVNLTLPLATWLGLSDAPGNAAGYGPLDSDDSRAIADALAARADTRWCLTFTGSDGRPVAHGCARAGPAGTPRDGPRTGAASQPGSRAPGEPGSRGSARTWTFSLTLLAGDSCDHAKETAAYRPSPALHHLVGIRHATCTYPGCRRSAMRCDADHTVAYHRGGKTCLCNLAPLCREHHRAKQAEGWHLHQPQPGVMVWRLPHGRTYVTVPSEYPM